LNAFVFLESATADPQFTGLRALILDKLGRNSEARLAHEQSLQRDPEQPQFWLAYGHNLRAAGLTDEAIAAYRRVIEIEFEHGEAWWSLANIKQRVLSDGDIDAMDRALSATTDILNIVPLHFALGRAWHDRQHYDRAFDHYREGNRLRADTIQYDPAELTGEVDEYIRITGPDSFPVGDRSNGEPPIPIFLISMPRSGSTLLEQILGQHPDIEVAGELPYVRALMRSALELHTRRGPVTAPQLIERMSAGEKRAFGADYLQRAGLHRRTDARYLVDKAPMNWSDIPFIREILPQARFIEIRRNAMDCCFSNFVHHFSLAHAPSFDLVHQARCYVDYTRLIDHIAAVAPGFICQLRYEQLIEQPEPVLRGVLQYLGLEWDDALLRFHESDRVVRTPSSEQVRRPLNRQGIGVWRPYAAWLGPLREALGPLADA
jgi:tetratricopeptide (TPR) repeat protein